MDETIPVKNKNGRTNAPLANGIPATMPAANTPPADAGRYAARGVSASKADVHAAVDTLDSGLFPYAFCKIIPDVLTGDPNRCAVIHSDGAGTKAIVAYLKYKEAGDASVFRGTEIGRAHV